MCAFGCGSWTGRSQPQSVVLNTQRRSYHWSHWHIWHGVWLPTNDHPVSLCPSYIHRVKVYEKPTEGWQLWPGSRRRSVPKSPDSKWSWELRAPQLILVTACEHRLLFKGNQPRAYRGGRTAQSPPHLRVNRLQALSCLSEFVHISKHYFFWWSHGINCLLIRRCSVSSFGLCVSPVSSRFIVLVLFALGKLQNSWSKPHESQWESLNRLWWGLD